MSEVKGKKDIKLWLFAAVAVIGILLLVFGGGIFGEKEKNEGVEATVLDPDAYAKKVEEEVEALCRSATGGYAAEAVVSLAGGYRSVYATDAQSSSGGYKYSMVLVGNGSNEGAVLLCYENPEISGIGIVLSCRESEAVRNDVLSLISAAFDVRTNKIHIAFCG